jgi:hypothetical protein
LHFKTLSKHVEDAFEKRPYKFFHFTYMGMQELRAGFVNEYFWHRTAEQVSARFTELQKQAGGRWKGWSHLPPNLRTKMNEAIGGVKIVTLHTH